MFLQKLWNKLKDETACFGGGGSTPSVTPTPTPAPAPTIIEPTEVAASGQEDRRKKIEKMRFGLASTIKTSPLGVVGNAANLQPAMGKKLTGQ